MPITETAADPCRRRLLRTGAIAMLALAVPNLGACAQGGGASRGDQPVKIGVIGSGRLGGTVGGLWVKSGHPVLFSSRHPESLKTLVDELGPLARAGTVAEAIAFSNVLFLATPYNALPQLGQDHPGAGRARSCWTRPMHLPSGMAPLPTRHSATASASPRQLPGRRARRARVNFMGAANFAREHHRQGERVAVPIAGDDAAALRVAEQLVRDAGFEPVLVGPLASADKFAPGGPLFRQIGSVEEMRRKMSGQ